MPCEIKATTQYVATYSSMLVHLSQAVQLPLKIFQTAAVLEVGIG
jgi:hypothetical protein